MAHNERFEELVALQALSLPEREEAAELSRHLQDGCAECERLLVDFRVAASALAVEAPARRPSPEVKRRLLASLGPARVSAVPSARASWIPALIGLAAALLLAVFVTDDLHLRRQRERLRSRSVQLSERLESVERDLARRDLRVKVLESDDVKVLMLDGKDPQPAARAKVFWSEKAKRGILVAGNLSVLPADKQYELWVFADSKPVPAGVFDADPAGRALFESTDLSAIVVAQNFAVTVEPRGGVPQPTGPIVLVGSPS